MKEGGYRLVAVASDAEDSLVAEAGYAMLPDGNAEFALTVADGWRGWLGPYLLDALVTAAAARHVPNLQADVLVENTLMLTLLASRGYVTLRRQSSEVRVAIAAAQPAKIMQQNRSRPAAWPACARLTCVGEPAWRLEPCGYGVNGELGHAGVLVALDEGEVVVCVDLDHVCM